MGTVVLTDTWKKVIGELELGLGWL